MNEKEIKRLIKIVEESDIGELEIKHWGRTIRISKSVSPAFVSNSNSTPASTQQIQPVIPQPVAEKKPPSEAAITQSAEATTTNSVEIKSPMVGTFFCSPAPDADPYIKVNDTVQKGQVLCIIEAMKLMNEIESEADGRIVEILVENGQPVEYSQPLFLVEPN